MPPGPTAPLLCDPQTARLCPLSRVRAGTAVRIKQLLASPEVCHRLRELGLGEEKDIKLLLRQQNIVCQVCNVRLGLSAELADSIWVEPAGLKPQPA